MANKTQEKKKGNPLIGLAMVVLFMVPQLIPIGIIAFVIYKIVKKTKGETHVKSVPLSSAQRSEKKEQPPQSRPAQPIQAARPVQTRENPAFDPNKFVRTPTDYAARHRENAKRMLDAGLIDMDEYKMQMERSKRL